MNEFFGLLDDVRIVPVASVTNPDDARRLGEALTNGGLPVVEITLRTANAVEAIRTAAEVPGLLVGAGTVTRAEQLPAVLDAGARFVVSPGLSSELVRHCQLLGIPVLPGVSTATELMAAIELGCDVVKFFPASTAGAAPAIKALAAPFPDVRFVPTGGVTLDNLREYLALPSVLAVGGSWMLRGLAAGDFEAIAEESRRARDRAEA